MTPDRVTPDLTRQPVHVHCGKCEHEWICAYLPMSISKLTPLMKAPCPMCGGRPVLLGKLPRITQDGDAIGWLTNGDTGVSSQTIWHVLMGQTMKRGDVDAPHDPDDFGRCYRLLKVMPSWRARLGEVAAKYPIWRRLVDRWDDVAALYEEELPSGDAPKCDALIQELRGGK